MKSVALFGESPSDTQCIASIMKSGFKKTCVFFDLVEDIPKEILENEFRGAKLFSKEKSDKSKLRRLLNRQFRIKRPDLVIFVIDLDSHEKDRLAKLNRLLFFRTYKKQVDNRAILLLNIHELEALLLADILTINKIYSSAIEVRDEPMNIVDPKSYLEKGTKKKYNDSHNQELFKKVSFEDVVANCRYFSSFVSEFRKIIQS